MAETPYTPSSSGFTSDSWFIDRFDNYYNYQGKNGWSTGTSTMVQGSTQPSDPGGQGYHNCNFYGVAYFDFAALRTKAQTHTPKSIRIWLKSHTSANRTVYLHMGKGMAKDSYTSGARPTDATGTSVKTFSIASNAAGEITITDTAWLAALVDPTTTCIYVNNLESGTKPTDPGAYCEFDGAATGSPPMLYVDWEPKGTVRYCADGQWKECEVYYGSGGAWVRVAPHYCTDGTWKPIGG